MDIEKTRTELVREAAEKLEIVGTGQPLEAEYADRIDKNVDPLLLQLAEDGICNVASDQNIPSAWFNCIAALLANISGSLAGREFNPEITVYYESELRRLTSSSPSYNVLEIEYF